METPNSSGKGTSQTVPVRDSMNCFSRNGTSLTGVDIVRTDKKKALLSDTSRVADRPLAVDCAKDS